MSSKKVRIVSWILAIALLWPPFPVFAEVEDFIDKFAANNIMFYNPEDCQGGSQTVSTVGGTAVVSGSTAQEKLWSGLKSMGLSDEVTAGIMGNMTQESGLSPARYEDKWKSVWESGFDWEHDTAEGHGVGLIQWSGSRRIEFFKWMREQNNDLVEKYLKKPGTYGAMSGDQFIQAAGNEAEVNALYSLELTFLIQEMQGNDAYKKVFDQTTVTDAAIVFSVNVEGCSTCTATSDNTKDRRDYADGYFQDLSGNSTFGPTVTASSGVKQDGSDVTWIGDSISEGAKAKILEKLPKADTYVESGKSWSSRRSPGGESGMTILEKLKNENKLRDNLVFALGTNDDNVDENAIKKIVQTAPEVKKVVLVLNFDRDNEHAYDDNNEAIKKAPSIDNRFSVADWPSAIKNDAATKMRDNVHPTEEGSVIFVDTVIKALGSLSQQKSSVDQCCNQQTKVQGDGAFIGQKYDLTDGQIKGLLAVVKGENGENLETMKTEATIMPNLFEYYKKNAARTGDGLVDYVLHGGWFASSTTSMYSESYSDYKQEEFDAVKDIWVNGNRTMPPQIVEHDCIRCSAGVDHAYNDGVEFDITDRSKFISGKTKLVQASGGLSGSWIFYQFADKENKKGDPFGYFENNPPTESTQSQSQGSSITWQDGWIAGGIDGYKKESAENMSGLDSSANKEFATDAANGKGKGPNKITLHSTEGPNGSGTSGLEFFQSSGVPPHFTIDMHEKHVFQHFSINKTSGAVAKVDAYAGIQIEIIGYSDAQLASSRGHSKWILSSGFSNEDVAYLAKLLIGISAETGIPLESSVDWSGGNNPKRMPDDDNYKNYKGILGHRHTPQNDHWDPDGIWDQLKKAIGAGDTADTCGTISASGDVAALQKLVLRWAWPTYRNGVTKKAEYDEDIKKSKYVGDSCYGGGVDCGGFVHSLVTLSGWDEDYPVGNTETQQNTLAASDKWKDVTSTIKGNSDAQPGDVIICNAGSPAATPACIGSGTHHVLIFVGKIDGFDSEMASASQCGRAPCADGADDISHYVGSGYSVYRKVK